MKYLMRGMRRMLLTALVAGTGMTVAAPAYAQAVDADDYPAGALPEGTNLALVYYQHVDRDQINADGRKVADGNLISDVAILRYAHFVKIGPFIADPQFLLPIGRLRGSGAQNGLGSSGTQVGDIILAATVWLYNDPKAGRFFGITPFVFAPIGNYDRNQSLNLGENRWKFTGQAAYVTPIITKKLVAQISADATFYATNNDSGAASQRLTQKPLFQLQEWLMYRINGTFDVRLGSAQLWGGRQELDGLRLSNSRTETISLKAGVGWNFAKSWNLLTIYGRDGKTENGFRERNRINLRLLKAF